MENDNQPEAMSPSAGSLTGSRKLGVLRFSYMDKGFLDVWYLVGAIGGQSGNRISTNCVWRQSPRKCFINYPYTIE